MVEMVFVLPVLLLVLFAIAEFGIMFSRWLTLSNAVREGARTGVAYRSPCVEKDVHDDAREALDNYASAGGIDPNDLTAVSITGMCDPVDPADPVNTGRLTVTATYPFPLNVPYATTLGTINLQYSSTMRNE